MLLTVQDLALEFRDGSRWLRAVVRRQPFPTAELDWDRDALDAILEVDTDIFRGSFGTTLWRHELANLRALLQALLDQLGQHLKASFALIEHGAAFEFEKLAPLLITHRLSSRTTRTLQFSGDMCSHCGQRSCFAAAPSNCE